MLLAKMRVSSKCIETCNLAAYCLKGMIVDALRNSCSQKKGLFLRCIEESTTWAVNKKRCWPRYCGGWNPTQWHGGYFINHEIRIPIKQPGDDSMESKAVFFSLLAQFNPVKRNKCQGAPVIWLGKNPWTSGCVLCFHLWMSIPHFKSEDCLFDYSTTCKNWTPAKTKGVFT